MMISKCIGRLFTRSLFTVTFVFGSVFAQAEVDIIVHSSVNETASKDDLSRLYLGKTKSLAGGTTLEPINLQSGNPVRDEFNDKILGKSDAQLKSHWSRLVFTGKAQPPKDVGSDAEVIGLVKSNPGMIGYVSSGAAGDGVKVIATF
jgi:ABC-type phosphate transport system substrate-binding protein